MGYEKYKTIDKKISFEDEYINSSTYAEIGKLKKDGKPKLADNGTYKRYIQQNEYEFD